jgi:Uma2 family endonuclease
MAVPKEKLIYTIAQYLAMERAAEERHEYVDGIIYKMSGESLSHSRICINLAISVGSQLRGKPCEALSPNMKVRSGPYFKDQRTTKGLFSYADLTVVCGEPEFHDQHQDVLLNPTVIFEVLSDSTEDYDRGLKFLRYRAQIASLQEYVLVWQLAPTIEVFTRQANGWFLAEYTGLESVVYLPSIDCHLSLQDIFDRVVFPDLNEEEGEASEPHPA